MKYTLISLSYIKYKQYSDLLTCRHKDAYTTYVDIYKDQLSMSASLWPLSTGIKP